MSILAQLNDSINQAFAGTLQLRIYYGAKDRTKEADDGFQNRILSQADLKSFLASLKPDDIQVSELSQPEGSGLVAMGAR
jgi:hypothetical protein